MIKTFHYNIFFKTRSSEVSKFLKIKQNRHYTARLRACALWRVKTCPCNPEINVDCTHKACNDINKRFSFFLRFFAPSRLFIKILVSSFLFFYPPITQAQETEDYKTYSALSMVGESRYKDGAKHLSYVNPDAPKGGVLKQAAIGTYDTLNPLSIKGKAAEGLNLTTDRLMARIWDEPFTLVPLIATKVEMPDDRSAIIFHLNDKARFHDGTPIRAADVLFSFKTLKESGRPNMRRLYQLATPEILSPRKIKFTFGEGYDRETALIFAMMPIIAQKFWKDRDFDSTILEIPMGSGPYRVVKSDPGKAIIYERVKDYWAQDLLANEGLHNFDTITYTYFRDDTVAFESFKKGDLSLRREWDAGDWHARYNFENDDIVKEKLKHGRAEKVRGFIFNSRRAPFDDKKVRQALTLLFDFNWMNKNLFYDAYKQVNSFFPNTDLGKTRPTDQRPLRQKRRAAETLLKEAGWLIKDGQRVNKAGETLSFEILLDNPAAEKIALAYTRDLKKAGIEARVRVLDSAAFRGRINQYDFDMMLYHWNSTLSPGTEQFLYWSCESAKTPYRWNFAGICDEDIDRLAQAIPTSKTADDLKARTQALDTFLWDGAYFVPLYYNPYDYVAYWDDIERPQIVPLYGMVIESWWHEPNKTNDK